MLKISLMLPMIQYIHRLLHAVWLTVIRPLSNRYTGFLLFLIVYTRIMHQFGGLPPVLTAWRLEIPLVFYLYVYFNLITRKSRVQFLAAALPVLLVYGVFDAYHLLLGRLIRLSEVAELPEMFSIMPWGAKISVFLLMGLPLVFFLWSLSFSRFRPMLLGALPLLAILVTVERYPDFFIDAFKRTQKTICWYSDTESAGTSGRISMALYNEALRNSSLKKIGAYRGDAVLKKTFDDQVATVSAIRTKSNVHLVMLESFIDPNLFLGARFSRNPIHPSFDALFKNKAGFSISPVFGGATAQAEFEALSGVPALREISGIEFNVFTGAKTRCLPNLLALSGYHTIATNAFLPDFFNSTNAYKGLGFEDIYYAEEYAPGRDTYFSTGDVTDEMYMFDGVLFTQNIAFVEKWIKNNPDKPLFNYINSIYGHLPHILNPGKRPQVVKLLGKFRDDQFERAANQCYYRTEALAAFVKELVRMDPKSIIILVSDHLPALTYGPGTYRSLNYNGKSKDHIHLNRIYIVENGQPVRYGTLHHYDIPRLILSYVTHKKFKPNNPTGAAPRNTCSRADRLHEQYMAIMAEAMNDAPALSPIAMGVPAAKIN